MANLPDNIVAGGFTFTNVGQVAELGQATGNVATMQAYLDARGLDLMGWLNEILTSLKSTDGSANIARTDDGYGANVEAALQTLIGAGSGTVPPDGTITNAKMATDVKIGSLASLTTTIKTSIQAAINEIDAAGWVTDTKLASDVKIGSLAALTATIKTSVVAALNAIDANDWVTTVRVNNGAITYAKLDSGVQDTLNLVSITEQTGTTYTTDLADAGTLIEMNNGSAITVTIPPNSSVAYDVGAWIALYQKGAGQVTISPGSGVTIKAPNSSNKIATQYGRCVLIKQATDTWSLGGWITA